MSPALANYELARAVFERLARARRRNPSPQTPWGADWYDFLEQARIHSAEDQSEALRVARRLDEERLLALKFLRDGLRPRRLTVPLAAERAWFAAFNQTYPADITDERAKLASVP